MDLILLIGMIVATICVCVISKRYKKLAFEFKLYKEKYPEIKEVVTSE